MSGGRDQNLRSGDLHEELGLLLLRTIGLVAPVPRPEDVGIDALVTLLRPEGSRRLLPGLSFFVQLKAASIRTLTYSKPDEISWITKLEIPFFIGRVDLKRSRMELYATHRLHQILLEHAYQKICLLLNPGKESSKAANARHVNIGPPVHAWSLEDTTQAGFLRRSHEILRPHVEILRQNRHLREIQYLKMLKWETGSPPEEGGIMMVGLPEDNAPVVLQAMVPSVRGLLTEIMLKKRYGDFPVLLALVQMMRRWGVDPDPDGDMLRMTAYRAEGPEISDEDVIRLRYSAGFNHLNLTGLKLSEASLAAIHEEVENLEMADVPITDAGVIHLLRLTKLSRLNLAGSGITDFGMDQLAILRHLVWLNIERTRVTADGISRLKINLPEIEIVS